jgi:hypothetical protein
VSKENIELMVLRLSRGYAKKIERILRRSTVVLINLAKKCRAGSDRFSEDTSNAAVSLCIQVKPVPLRPLLFHVASFRLLAPSLLLLLTQHRIAQENLVDPRSNLLFHKRKKSITTIQKGAAPTARLR